MKKRVIIGCIIVIIMLVMPITTATTFEHQISNKNIILDDLDIGDINKIQITSEELTLLMNSLQDIKNKDEDIYNKILHILDESISIDKNQNIWLDLEILEQGLIEISPIEISASSTSATFIFAHIAGSVKSFERTISSIEIFGSLEITGFGTVCRYNGCVTGWQTCNGGHVKTSHFIGILNDKEVNGIAFPIVNVDDGEKNKNSLSASSFFHKLIERFPFIYQLIILF